MAYDLEPGSVYTLGALEVLLRRPDWHRDGLCREYPGLPWVPESGERTDACKSVCRRCLVLHECHAWAMAQDNRRTGLQGIFAGLSRQERLELQQGRQAA